MHVRASAASRTFIAYRTYVHQASHLRAFSHTTILQRQNIHTTMIAKLNKGTGFGGLVNYANDIKQKDTNIIASDGVSLTNNKTIATSFKLQACGNPKVKKYVGHAMLSFSPKDKPLLTDAFVEKIAKDYLRRMGIVNAQFVIFRHHDQPHGHVHIVYNRVDNIMQVLEPAERIADVITDLAVQPDVVPAMGGGGGSTSDLKWNDDDKERRRPQTTDYIPSRKPRR